VSESYALHTQTLSGLGAKTVAITVGYGDSDSGSIGSAARRSTSIARESANSMAKNPIEQVDSKGMLCSLPDRFFFGQYSKRVSP